MGSSSQTKKKLKQNPFKSAEEMKEAVRQIELELWTENKKKQLHMKMLIENEDFKSITEFYDDWSVVYETEDSQPNEIVRFNLTDKNRPKLIISKKLERIAGGTELAKAIIQTTWPDYTEGVQRLFKLWSLENKENSSKIENTK